MGVHFKENEEKITIGMILVGIAIIVMLMASLIVYLLNLNSSKSQNDGTIEQQVGEIAKNENDDSKTVSIDIGKSKNESEKDLATNSVENKNETKMNNTESKTNTYKNTTTTNTINTNNETKSSNRTKNENTTKENNIETNKQNQETVKSTEEVKFSAPINGEILRDFALDTLVYSDTLEEWITHNGVDIKADKTSVVKCALAGTVESIKNDPRYGLTVIVNHENGYKTVYANLLTAEYVVEGEKIDMGQTIGTVGNSATFEISDDYHLHFEIIKDGKYLNPTTLISF